MPSLVTHNILLLSVAVNLLNLLILSTAITLSSVPVWLGVFACLCSVFILPHLLLVKEIPARTIISQALVFAFTAILLVILTFLDGYSRLWGEDWVTYQVSVAHSQTPGLIAATIAVTRALYIRVRGGDKGRKL